MKKILCTVFVLAAVACAVVAFVMLKYPALELEKSGSCFTLSDVAFGCKIDGNKFLDMSFLNMLPYILLSGVLGGLIVQFIAIFAKEKQGGRKLFTPFAIVFLMVLFIGAGILFLYAKEFTKLYVPNELYQKNPEFYDKLSADTLSPFKLGNGAVAAAVCCFVGAGMGLISGIMHFVLKDKN